MSKITSVRALEVFGYNCTLFCCIDIYDTELFSLTADQMTATSLVIQMTNTTKISRNGTNLENPEIGLSGCVKGCQLLWHPSYQFF